MTVAEYAAGDSLVLSPQEALVASGPAEEYEERVQTLFRQGYRHLVTDLRDVPHIDSRGIRALVRGYTTAQRVGGTFKLASPNTRVRNVLHVASLDTVFETFDSIADARARPWPWHTVRLVAFGIVLCGALLAVGIEWRDALGGEPVATSTPFGPYTGVASPGPRGPFLELFKLVVAALIGVLVTSVHRRYRHDKPLPQAMEQAQVLLCVSGALVMIIIGDNLARAFGIAGAAAIIRFRTPVEDPKDITILFLLMALGMASGLGAIAVAGIGTAFLCICLVALDMFGLQKPRVVVVEIVSDGREFPSATVHEIFARNGVRFETREVSQGKDATIRYHATLDPAASMEDLGTQLMNGGGVKSVTWEAKKSG